MDLSFLALSSLGNLQNNEAAPARNSVKCNASVCIIAAHCDRKNVLYLTTLDSVILTQEE